MQIIYSQFKLVWLEIPRISAKTLLTFSRFQCNEKKLDSAFSKTAKTYYKRLLLFGSSSNNSNVKERF